MANYKIEKRKYKHGTFYVVKRRRFFMWFIDAFTQANETYLFKTKEDANSNIEHKINKQLNQIYYLSN